MPSLRAVNAVLVGTLTLATVLVASCDTTTMMVTGCSTTSCAKGTVCRMSDGKCIVPPKQVTVEVQFVGDGTGTVVSTPAGISCGSQCSASFEVGTKITLSATPALGSVASGWSLGCQGSTPTCELTPDGTLDPIPVLLNLALDATSTQPPLCNEYGFCWENPRPFANTLRRVIVPAQGEPWMVGDAGAILRRVGGTFQIVPSTTRRTLYSIWGTPTELFAVGDAGTILRWGGTAFAAEPSGTVQNLYDVHGGGGTPIAVGTQGKATRRSGGIWTEESTGTLQTLYATFGVAPNNHWALGAQGITARYSAGWTSATEPVFQNYTVRAITGVATNLFAIDSFGGVSAYTVAGGWQLASRIQTDDMEGIGLVGSSLYTVGRNPGGTGFIMKVDAAQRLREVNNAPAGLRAIAGGSTSDIWAVGDSGLVYQYTGSGWSSRSSGSLAPLNAVAAVGDQDAWFAGSTGTLLHYLNGTVQPVASGATGTLASLFALSPTNLWAVGSSGQILRYNGTAWSTVPSPTTQNLTSVHGLTSNQLWAVGENGTILQWNGTTWSALPSPVLANLRSVSAAGLNEVWIVGDGGTVLRSTGGAFQAVTPTLMTTANLLGVYASGTDTWVVADSMTFLQRGGVWSNVAPPLAGLRSVFARSAGEVYVTGTAGTLLRLVGGAWQVVPTGAGTDLQAGALSTSRLWLTGTSGTLLRKTL